MIELVIPGKPIAKARPQFWAKAIKGKVVSGTYNRQTTEEGLWLLEAQKQLGGQGMIRKMVDGVVITMTFFMPRPKSHYGTGRNATKLKERAPKQHKTTPDLDNCVKFVMDCLNHLGIWIDDAQVVKVNGWKLYSERPRTFVQISEL